jgi:hypothetical protein
MEFWWFWLSALVSWVEAIEDRLVKGRVNNLKTTELKPRKRTCSWQVLASLADFVDALRTVVEEFRS